MSSAGTERSLHGKTSGLHVYKCKGTSKKGTEEDLSRDKTAVEEQKPGAPHAASFGDGGRPQEDSSRR